MFFFKEETANPLCPDRPVRKLMVESKDKMGCRTGASVLVVLPGVALTRPEMVLRGVDGLDGSCGLWMRLRSSIVRLVGKKNTTDRLVIGTIAGSGKGKKQVSHHRIRALRYESGRQQVGSTSKGDIHLIIVHHWRLSCIWNWLHESVIIITIAMCSGPSCQWSWGYRVSLDGGGKTHHDHASNRRGGMHSIGCHRCPQQWLNQLRRWRLGNRGRLCIGRVRTRQST